MSELYAKYDVERAVREAAEAGHENGAGQGRGFAALLPIAISQHILASLTPVRLPVIETCGECGWWDDGLSMSGEASLRPYCDRTGDIVEATAAPPETCPLRRPR